MRDDNPWLDMSEFPDVEPEAAVSDAELAALRAHLAAAEVPDLPDEEWDRMLAAALDGPDTPPAGPGENGAGPRRGGGPRHDGAAAPGAQRTSDSSTDEVAPGFNTLRGEILDLFPGLTARARRLRADETAARLDSARERLASAGLTVVVCGEFKRGKSSLLNALLEESEELFPVDTSSATSVVTTVRHGSAERVTVTLDTDTDEYGDGGEADGDRRETRSISRAQIRRYVTEDGNPLNRERARLVEIETPNPRLAAGLTFVDTPGVGGIHAEHTAVTSAFLPSADALVFVTDVSRPLTASELTFLRRAMRSARTTDDADGQIFVLTKTDTVGDWTPMLRDTAAKLADVTGRPPEEIRVIAVSSRAKLAHLADGDPEDLELSNFPELEQALRTALFRRRARLLLLGALAELDAAALALLRPVGQERAALAENTDAELTRLSAESRERAARLTRLDEESSVWRTQLATALRELRLRLRREANRRLADIWAQLNSRYLYEAVYLDNPDRLLVELTADASEVLGAVNELASREAARIVGDLSRLGDLELIPEPIGRLPALPVPPLPPLAPHAKARDPERRTLLNAGVGLAAGSSAGAAAGTGIGAVVGTVLLPGVGSLLAAQVGALIGSAVGAIAGTGAGYVTAARSINEEETANRREALRRVLAPLRAEQQAHLDDAVAEVVDAWSRAAVAELASRIARERESTDRTLSRLEAARRTAAADAQARLAELDTERAALETVRLRTAALTECAGHLASARPPGPDAPPAGPRLGTLER